MGAPAPPKVFSLATFTQECQWGEDIFIGGTESDRRTRDAANPAHSGWNDRYPNLSSHLGSGRTRTSIPTGGRRGRKQLVSKLIHPGCSARHSPFNRVPAENSRLTRVLDSSLDTLPHNLTAIPGKDPPAL